ncbi:MAG: M20/M25/M40 family metallo-hydrolase [Fusobacteriaceae bacterium]|jgi:amidohydrolase|nr:M20/M25/M40 family metallo-hydrolase [Fusobacteriaceae bacterium]
MTDLEKILNLRKTLHEHPNLSLNERKTTERLMEFLRENTDLEIIDKGDWFYAAHREKGAQKNIAFRCDTDAIPGEDGKPYHGCGHDGHMALVCALALAISRKTFGKNIFLLFQPAEETGQGALICRDFVPTESIDEIYGLHSTPGFPEGRILLLKEVYACASEGVTISLTGRQSHAAHPEHGLNPAFLIAKIIGGLDDFLRDPAYKSLVLATIVHVLVGGKNFGVNPGSGEISLTIRAHYQSDLERLQKKLEEYVALHAKEESFAFSFSYNDVFPDTVNDATLFEKIRKLLEEKHYDYEILPDPSRASEDFGHFAKQTKAFYFGVGAGKNWPSLHTKNFEFNDALIPVALRLFLDVINL